MPSEIIDFFGDPHTFEDKLSTESSPNVNDVASFILKSDFLPKQVDSEYSLLCASLPSIAHISKHPQATYLHNTNEEESPNNNELNTTNNDIISPVLSPRSNPSCRIKNILNNTTVTSFKNPQVFRKKQQLIKYTVADFMIQKRYTSPKCFEPYIIYAIRKVGVEVSLFKRNVVDVFDPFIRECLSIILNIKLNISFRQNNSIQKPYDSNISIASSYDDTSCDEDTYTTDDLKNNKMLKNTTFYKSKMFKLFSNRKHGSGDFSKIKLKWFPFIFCEILLFCLNALFLDIFPFIEDRKHTLKLFEKAESIFIKPVDYVQLPTPNTNSKFKKSMVIPDKLAGDDLLQKFHDKYLKNSQLKIKNQLASYERIRDVYRVGLSVYFDGIRIESKTRFISSNSIGEIRNSIEFKSICRNIFDIHKTNRIEGDVDENNTIIDNLLESKYRNLFDEVKMTASVVDLLQSSVFKSMNKTMLNTETTRSIKSSINVDDFMKNDLDYIDKINAKLFSKIPNRT